MAANKSPWIELILNYGPIVITAISKIAQLIFNKIKYRGFSENSKKTAFAFQSYSWNYLQKSAPIIYRVGTLERPEVDQVQQLWETTTDHLVLNGEAGLGKTEIARRLGQLLSNKGVPVLFISAIDLPNDEEPITIIQSRLPLSNPLIESIAELGKERNCVVIIDQLDSVAGTDLCKNLIGFIRSLENLLNVKILVISRTYELQHDQYISSLGFKEIKVGLLTSDQVTSYLLKFGINNPSQELVDISTNLLNLSLVADIVKNHDIGANDPMDEIDLWKQFLNSIQSREGDEVYEYVEKLARQVSCVGKRTFFINFPKREYKRKLLSRNVLVNTSNEMFAFRHEQMQDFLCAYSLMKDQAGLQEIMIEFGSNSPKGVIHWLHKLYHVEDPKTECKFIDDVLQARTELDFYTRTIVLINLRKQTNPSEEEARVLIKYSHDLAYQRFFFTDLDTNAWVIPLFYSGFFFKPPEPIEKDPGYFQPLPWPGGEYLVRFADQFEDIVVAVVRSISTENWLVQNHLINALLKISPQKTAELISAVDNWLSGRFSNMLPGDINPLSNYLVDNGYVDEAIQLLGYIILPILPPDNHELSDYHSPLHFRSDSYWVDDYCKKQLPKLIQQKPISVVSVFERLLEKTIDLTNKANPKDVELKVGYYWRMDIPNRSSERSDVGVLDILVDGFRDSLLELCKQNVEAGREFLTKHLNSKHIIFTRIALYSLGVYGKNYPDLINQVLLQWNFLEEEVFAKEYRRLMRNQFDNTSDEVKTKVIARILLGPDDVEQRVKRIAQWHQREVTKEDYQEARDRWALWHLGIIKDFLKNEDLARLNLLVSNYGEPDTDEKPSMTSISWDGVPSPVSREELEKKSFEKLKHLFLNYVPDDLFLNPRIKLAQTFQKLVSEDPERFNGFATLLVDPKIRYVYIYHYLSGVHNGVNDKSGKLTDEILNLCEYVVSQKEDPFEDSSGEHEPGLFMAQMEIARLLKKALNSEDLYLTREQLNLIRSLLTNLAHHPDPELGTDDSTSLDPYTHSLNCIRGVAMHGIVSYSLYLVHAQEKQLGKKLDVGFLESEIKQLLDEKLDISLEPSLAIHSIYGAFFPQLEYLAHEWAIQNLQRIFPENEELYKYWKAAWDAYIFVARRFRDIFKLLIPQYERGLHLLQYPRDERKYIGGSPDENLAQHMMWAYLNELTDFGHENALLDLFFENASDQIRSQGIFWLSQVLNNDKPSVNDFLWKKCWILWQKRLTYAETQDVSKNSSEISDYMRWLTVCPLGLDALNETLQKSVKYINGLLEIRLLAGFAAKYSDQLPFEAVSLLKMIIVSPKEPWWTPEKSDEEHILRSALTSRNTDAGRIAREIINYRGEQGNFDWKDLLQ